MSSEDRNPAEVAFTDEEDEEELIERGELADDELEEEGEDLFDERNLERDYRHIPELDQYDQDYIAEDPEIDYEQEQQARLAAERAMNRRDMNAGNRLADDDDMDLGGGSVDMDVDNSDNDGAEDTDIQLDIGQAKGKLSEWLANDITRKDIHDKFKKFLHNFKDADGKVVYLQKLDTLARCNQLSLEVDYVHILQSEDLQMYSAAVLDEPKIILDILGETVMEYLDEKHHFKQIVNQDKVFVRLYGIVRQDSIRDLRINHLNQLVLVEGVVTRRTNVYPQLSVVKYNCMKCGFILGPFQQNGQEQIIPRACANCSGKGPFAVNTEKTMYRNYQKINLQETPGKVPPGRLPRSKEVILLHDLIDTVRPGEEVQVVGIYMHSYSRQLNMSSGFPLMNTYIEANNIIKSDDQYSSYHITEEDKQQIRELSQRPDLAQLIMNSIAPSIYGHEDIKQSLCLALFGGEEKYHVKNGARHRIRGDINMLVLGDPGTGKSQFLKYVEKTAQRVVSTTGKGASAVGLTAAVHKDPVTKEWTLEGGALVLADKGICLIDEFDKMNDHDRVSIHEAMEQQSISISKAGIVTQLQARCCVIAAANPTTGRYNSSRTFAENVQLSDPILSRFDILCVVKDLVDPVVDKKLAGFVIGSHARARPVNAAQPDTDEELEQQTGPIIEIAGKPSINQELLKKYIVYAKRHHPRWASEGDMGKIVEVYTELRKESALSHAMPIAVRHLESMVRLAEAHAKMHLRSLVQNEDIAVAVKLMLKSFISTQKYNVQRRLEKRFGKYLVTAKDQAETLLLLLRQLLRRHLIQEGYDQNNFVNEDQQTLQEEEDIAIPCRRLEQEAMAYGITAFDNFYRSRILQENGFAYDDNSRCIIYGRA